MSRYSVGPINRKGIEVETGSPELAYRALCCWYDPDTPVIVTNTENGATAAYIRVLDGKGNLQEVRRVIVG